MTKRITLKDIAKELDVSVTTISKAINNHPDISAKRRKQIMALLNKRNYVPNYMAKNLRSAKSKFISIIVSDNTNPYYARVIKGVEAVLSNEGYHTIIFNNDEDPEKELAMMRELLSINVAGVLITPALGNIDSVKLLVENDIPYVLVHRYTDKNKDNYVVADDIKAAYIATKHLLESHGPDIAFLNANRTISAANDRFTGYKKALDEAGVPFREQNIIEGIINQEQGYNAASTAIERMGRRKFSILCFSDYVATGAMLKVLEEGLEIPNEVAIMGIDDIEMFSYFYPRLSSVHLPKYELGAKSAEILLDIIHKRKQAEAEDEVPEIEDTRVIFEPKLSIKGTT